MKDLAKTYLKYGVPSNWASKYEAANLAATEFRTLSLAKLEKFYEIPRTEAKFVKECLTRQQIDSAVMEELLINNNFTCCCCKGEKSDAYIIHHIVKYELSQDNTYPNLAVLCPNDHDLAHRPTALTSGLSEDQIRAAKADWEQVVQVQRFVAATPIDLSTFYLKIPRYQKMQEEIDGLKRTIEDKERMVGLSAALLVSETERSALRLNALQVEKEALEERVRSLLDKISQLRPGDSSALQSAAIRKFLAGDIDGALDVLNERELDAQMEQLFALQDAAAKGLRQNVHDRLFRSTLLLLDGRTRDACALAGQTLEMCRNISDRMPDFMFNLVDCYEEVGTIYFNADLVNEAEAVFQNGLDLAWNLYEHGDTSIVPFIPEFLHNLGTIQYARKDFEDAKAFLEDSANWYSDLKDVYDDIPGLERNPMDHRLVKNLTNLATTYDALGMNVEAAEAIARIDEFADAAFTASDQGEPRARYLSSKAAVLFRSGDVQGASALYEELIVLLTDLTRKYPKMYARFFADACLEACGTAYAIDPVSPRVGECCARAVQAGRRLVELEPTGDRSPLAYALMYSSFFMLRTDPVKGDYLAAANEAISIVNGMPPDGCDAQLLQGIALLSKAVGV